MFNPMISGQIYILSMSCVSEDEVQVAIHQREDILRWLKSLDHEGSNWTVVQHVYDPPYTLEDPSNIVRTDDLTDEIMKEYGED